MKKFWVLVLAVTCFFSVFVKAGVELSSDGGEFGDFSISRVDNGSESIGSISSSNYYLGNAAPPIKTRKWYRGDRISSYENGKVYVVELWATWCVHCIDAMPHLDKLAKEMKGDVEFVSINVQESSGLELDERITYEDEMITEFLTEGVGAKFSYGFAVDSEDKFIEKVWMPIAAQAGLSTSAIPLTFIVDQKGRMAWVGNPIADPFEKALRDILNNEYDLAGYLVQSRKKALAVKEKIEKDNADRVRRMSKLAPILEPIKTAINNGEFAEAIANAHKIVDDDPSLLPKTLLLRLEAYKNLLAEDEVRALELVQWEKSYAKNSTITKLPDGTELVMNRDNLYLDILDLFAGTQGLSLKSYKFAIQEMGPMRFDLRVYRSRSIEALCNAYYNAGYFEEGQDLAKKVAKAMKDIGSNYKKWELLSEKFLAAKEKAEVN